MSRIAYINPDGDWLNRRRDLVQAVGKIACTVNRPSFIDDIRIINPTCEIWAVLNVLGGISCKTSGGYWSAWHRWTDEQLEMIEPRLTLFAQDNYALPGIMYIDDSRRWPQCQFGYVAHDLTSLHKGKYKDNGTLSWKSPIEVTVDVVRDFLLAHEMVAGVQFDCSLRALGFPQNDSVFIPLRDLAPLASKLAVKQWSYKGVLFPEAEKYASGRALESLFTPAQGWLRALPEPDRLWAHYDATEFGHWGEGYKHVAGPACTLIYNPYSYDGSANAYQRFQLAVGMFMLHVSEMEKGPYFAAHDLYNGVDWSGILAQSELLEWIRMQPISPIIPVEDAPRVLRRVFIDDSGQRWGLNVNLSANDWRKQGALSARRVRIHGAE